MAGYYAIRRSTDQKFFFNLHAENHEKVLTSETYNTKANAQGGIKAVRENSPYDSRYKRKISTRGLHFFVLTAANGEPIGTSEEYSSLQAMENGIATVKKIGPTAVEIDRS